MELSFWESSFLTRIGENCAHVCEYSYAKMPKSQNDSSIRYPYGGWADEMADVGARATACSSYDRWINKSCVGILIAEYDCG